MHHPCLPRQKIKLNENRPPGGEKKFLRFVSSTAGVKTKAKVQFLFKEQGPSETARQKISGQPGDNQRRWLARPVEPPDHLSADEQQRFVDIVANCAATHFRPSDTTLLCRFVEADALAERAAKELRKASRG